MPDQTWRPLREPSPWLMQLFAIPLGIVSFAGIALLWLRATPLNLKLLSPHNIVRGNRDLPPVRIPLDWRRNETDRPADA